VGADPETWIATALPILTQVVVLRRRYRTDPVRTRLTRRRKHRLTNVAARGLSAIS
jgi:hypothetical protein